ncbi:uncharacterized protein LOC119722953 [Patiria miniata]|uniref:RNA-binding S4 domain-containing protein n=1 Tax=Patiria miniata TaxID=46514 RepID=A0A913ZEC5_PATMI|nr:uncharacterized protein LOC119722953 [Patiria miniata]
MQNMFPRLVMGIWQNVRLKQLHYVGRFNSATKKEVFSAFKGNQSHHSDVILVSRRRSASSTTGTHGLTGPKRFFRSTYTTEKPQFGQRGSEKRNTTSSKCITILPSSVRNSTRMSYLTSCCQKLPATREQLLYNVLNVVYCHQAKRCMASKASKAGKGKKKKQRISDSEDTDSDEESDDDIIKRDEDDLERDWDPEIDEKLSADEQEAGSSPEWKEIQQYVPSLRLDAVLSAGLGVSRKKIEEAYLGTKLRVNGEKVIKKSRQVKEGDILDMVLERSTPSQAKEDVNDDGLTVMRLHIMEISTDRTNKDRVPVLLRRWKNLRLIKEKK